MSSITKMTQRQKEVYEFVKNQIMTRGYGPTVREIGTEFGIRSPNGVMCHLKALERKGFITREANRSRAIRLANQSQLHFTTMPMAGQIAAGNPVLAEEFSEDIDFGGLFDNENQFCLKVKGDSMIEDHIAEGDYVVVKKGSTCSEGDIVVALVEGQDATLKRFYKEKDRIRLEPANSTMKPIYSSNVEVLGTVAGVIRQYA